ncbi:FAD-binding protein, partial [bacterium]|nr:FAD-binding protein [bacterium]
MKAIVVGSGVGGIASALRLRSMGIDVEILESCPDAGGRARTFSYGGHTFDAGPTVITAPWLFDE